MKDFRKLEVWQKAHGLVSAVYRETAGFPKEEIYGLTSQIRRAAVSMPANIAEGCGRNGDAELAHFLQMASGSASELTYELELARDLKYLTTEQYASLDSNLIEVGKMLNVLIHRIRSSSSTPPRAGR
ncbi:MAG: four helix bundle protein [Chloroflexi bacterium]|nr:four helix bundle protein [Chloroflexota bacterium]